MLTLIPIATGIFSMLADGQSLRVNASGISYDRWLDAILFGGVRKNDLPSERWLRARWREDADPSDVVVELLSKQEARRAPRTGSQTLESFSAALIRAFGEPESQVKYVKGMGLRWEMAPGSGVYVSVLLERDAQGRATAKVSRDLGPALGPFLSPDDAISEFKQQVELRKPYLQRVLLGREINGISESMGSASAEDVAAALRVLYAKYQVPAKAEPSMKNYVYVTIEDASGKTQQVTLYRRPEGGLMSSKWCTYNDPWPGKELAGLTKGK